MSARLLWAGLFAATILFAQLPEDHFEVAFKFDRGRLITERSTARINLSATYKQALRPGFTETLFLMQLCDALDREFRVMPKPYFFTLDDAEKKLLDILRQDEKNSYVLVRLAGVQMELNRLPEAEQTLNRALAVDSQDPVGLYLLGRLKFQQEQYDAALDSLSMAAKILPDEARTQYFLGKVLLQKGMRAQGETALRRAVNLRPGWGEAHYSLAMVYATAQPPFKELAQWHYQKALAGGYPRNQDFERMLEQKTTAKVP